METPADASHFEAVSRWPSFGLSICCSGGKDAGMRGAKILFILMIVAAVVQTGRADGPDSNQIGRFEVRFDSPSALASQQEAQKRFRWREKPQPFNLPDEVFQVVVPEGYQPDGTWGLFVWVSPTPSGRLPKRWVDSMQKCKLIWIGADNSQNERHIDHRCRLAVEAALQMIDRYEIDRKRVYIGGFSGGGKIAAMTAANYTEIFTGAYSICGPLFYRNIPTGVKKDTFYPQGYYPAPPKMMKVFREQTRHVLLTGDDDFNLLPTKQIHELGYVKDKFKHIELFVVPGLAHDIPLADWFERGIESLDRPLPPSTQPAR